MGQEGLGQEAPEGPAERRLPPRLSLIPRPSGATPGPPPCLQTCRTNPLWVSASAPASRLGPLCPLWARGNWTERAEREA